MKQLKKDLKAIMFGYGVRDQDSIATHLNTILYERNPSHKAAYKTL